MDLTHSARSVFVSTACVRGFPTLESQLQEYEAYGLKSVELGWSAPFAGSNLERYLQSRDAQYLIHNYFPVPEAPFVLNLASPSSQTLGQSRALAQRAIEMCGRVGATTYSVHAGIAGELTPQSLGGRLELESRSSREDAFAVLVESLRGLAQVAARAGVDLLLEPNVLDRRNLIDGRNELLLMVTADDIEHLFETLRASEVGLLLDTGHLNVSALTLGFDRTEFLERVAPYVRAFHVHDNDGTSDQHRPPRSESWVWSVLRDPRFTSAPAVIEAAFDSTEELARYNQWFLSELR